MELGPGVEKGNVKISILGGKKESLLSGLCSEIGCGMLGPEWFVVGTGQSVVRECDCLYVSCQSCSSEF